MINIYYFIFVFIEMGVYYVEEKNYWGRHA